MSHLSIVIITTICICSVVSYESLTTLLLEEIPISCRSRYQTEQDVEQFKTCVKNDTVRLKDGSVTQIQKFCEQDILKCFKELGNTLKHCITDDKHDQIFGHLIKAVEGGLEYACAYNGQPLKDFYEKGDCVHFDPEVRVKGNECVKNSPINSTNSYAVNFRSEETCSKLIQLTMCVIDVSNMCEDKTVRDFIKNLALNILNQTPCKNFTHQLYVYTPDTLISTTVSSFAPAKTINILVFLACSIMILNGAM